MNAWNGWVEMRQHAIKCGWKIAIKWFLALHDDRFAIYMLWHSRTIAEENNIYIYIYILERQVGAKAPTLLDPFVVRVWASAFSFQHSAFSISALSRPLKRPLRP